MTRHAPSGPSGRKTRQPRRSGSPDPTGGRLRAPDRHRRRAPGEATVSERLHHYLDLSRQPLQILVFLLPLILFYQVGTWYYSQAALAVMTAPEGAGASGEEGFQPPSTVISAYEILHDLFGLFGVTSLYLPGALLVTVLLVWHVVHRDRWRVHAGVPLVMLAESVALAMPLLVLDQLVSRFAGAQLISVPMFTSLVDVSHHGFQQVAAVTAGVAHAAQGGPESVLGTHPWLARLVISVGAGVYEELLFRLVVIAAVHALLVDVLRTHPRTGDLVAMLASALLFAFYHDLAGPDGTGIQLRLLLFYALAGIYFAALLVVRGFGIVVGAHAMYDVLVIVLLPAIAGLGDGA